ncbi:YjgF/Yer057p/UK114 family [Fusarium oxysporum Fo47]|uniref:Endoribonuclease L-PSP n=1 Tax=Fusarium oxysporum Fo47 TaxID=660027 RepID=W9KVS7_FUSOX|nr:YjgF/Yer057p/UK114 family [Fusarium oxysporum Fo47]EWZ46140.1 endoribonuclease L-PSP [Fusarium oxysporum Fo47]QKD52150.1 YjgF/Yer057p/UK114 family [Fusarium oxysporum Fo47]
MAGFEVVKANTCALPQYSQAVKYGDTVYCSGDIGSVPGTEWELAQGTAKDRARQALSNLSEILKAAESKLENVYKITIYITTMKNFALVNEAYDEFFTWERKPARCCIAVFELPLGTDVEIECSAYIDGAGDRGKL